MHISGGVFFDLRKSAILHFWPTPNPLYYTSDLLARGLQLLYGLLAAARGPLACPSRGARPPSLSSAALGPEIV